jgi:hypothetical protein
LSTARPTRQRRARGRSGWLRHWLAQAEPHLRPSTLHGYRDHTDRYLIPDIGRITLAAKRMQACFSLLAASAPPRER